MYPEEETEDDESEVFVQPLFNGSFSGSSSNGDISASADDATDERDEFGRESLDSLYIELLKKIENILSSFKNQAPLFLPQYPVCLGSFTVFYRYGRRLSPCAIIFLNIVAKYFLKYFIRFVSDNLS
jgi:hypothetical protein